MKESEIKEYLINFQKEELPELTKREIIVFESKKVISIIGPRRAGKTYYLFQKMQELIASGVKKESIIYLNFEDPKLVDINFKEIKEIIKTHWQLYPSSTKGKCYIFIDEPQNIKNWEISIRSLHDEGFYIFLTGSSSKLLSKEITTSLRGRTISYILLPFSFKEFLKIKNQDTDSHQLSSKEKSLLLNLLDEYIEFGGFPEIILENNKINKIKIINEYFNLIVYKDIIDRYRIKNSPLIKWLIRSLTTSFSKEYSIHNLYLTLKSKGIKVSKNTLYGYLSMLEDSFFVFLMKRFNYSIRKMELSSNKIYLCDIGFAKLVEFNKDEGKKMENIIMLELERRKHPLTNISYWKNSQQEEVDFIVKEGIKTKQLIQVCYDLDDIKTKKREVSPLLKASKELRCNDLLVITKNYEAEEKVKGKRIRYIPLWKWLLSEAKATS